MTHILRLIITIYAFLVLQGIAGAVTWQDDFDQETEDDNWQLQGSDSVWQIEDGYLRTEIQTEKQWRTIFELYQFIAFPGPYNNITIEVDMIGVTDAKFGIALGKHFLNTAGEVDEIGYYLFFTNDMQASRDGKVFAGPGKRWHTDELEQMILHFDDGRFQLIGNGEARMDFRDANLPQIDIIGFVLVTYVTDRANIGKAWVDKITISGLATSPKRKLTTTWGHLKQE